MLTEQHLNGWEHIASVFDAARSDIGSDVVRQWARHLPTGGNVLDLGCGSGFPISLVLADEGLTVFGVDASPTLVSMFRRRLGGAHAACATVQDSDFFGQTFDGVVAIGLMFLLVEADQRKLIDKVGKALRSGGRFLFSAPRQPCVWADMQTGQRSVSLGEIEYRRILTGAGIRLIDTYMDEGGSHYFDAALCSV